MKRLKDIERLVKKLDVNTNPQVNETVSAELLRAQAKHREERRLSRPRDGIRRPLVVRFPRPALICSLAAVFVAVVSCLTCFGLIRKVADLEHELELARRDVALAHVEGRLQEARDMRKETMSTLYHRAAELQRQLPRIPSANRICDPEEAYYALSRQNDLYY